MGGGEPAEVADGSKPNWKVGGSCSGDATPSPTAAAAAAAADIAAVVGLAPALSAVASAAAAGSVSTTVDGGMQSNAHGLGADSTPPGDVASTLPGDAASTLPGDGASTRPGEGAVVRSAGFADGSEEKTLEYWTWPATVLSGPSSRVISGPSSGEGGGSAKCRTD